MTTQYPIREFTRQEKRTLLAIAHTAGTDAQVAEHMKGMNGEPLATGTVKVYISNIRKKLTAQLYDVKSRYNLIHWAKEHQAELEGE